MKLGTQKMITFRDIFEIYFTWYSGIYFLNEIILCFADIYKYLLYFHKKVLL